MPLHSIPINVLQSKNSLATTERFVWLYEITVPSDPPTIYRITSNPGAVTFGQTEDGDALTYSPFPVTHGTIDLDSSGDLPQTTITASNVSRELIATLENYNGLLGQPVRIILAHSLSLGTAGVAVAEEDFRVIGAQATDASVALTLGSVDLFAAPVPKTRMTRFHCRFVYRSGECGYALPTENANCLLTCDKTLDGPNGCNAHGASYTSAGFTPIHPDRFGGFPGIPVNPTGRPI